MTKLGKNNAMNGIATAVERVRLSSFMSEKKRFSKLNNSQTKQYISEIYQSPDPPYTIYECWCFAKTLEHDAILGMPKHEDVIKLKEAVNNPAKISDIQLSPNAVRKLEGVNESSAFVLRGTDSCTLLTKHSYFTPGSMELASEMLEVYAKAINRDIPFYTLRNDINSGIGINEFLRDINSTNFTNTQFKIANEYELTRSQIFRGTYPDENVGPYISQFLVLPFKYGSIDIKQQHNVEKDAVDTVSPAEWLKIQNGEARSSPNLSGEKHYINNGRVLGTAVHRDPLYQFYYNAALIAAQNGVSVQTVPHSNTTVFSSGGMPNIFSSVADVSIGALRAAWYHKWNVGLMIRPEVLAQRYDLAHNLPPSELSKIPSLGLLKFNLDNSEFLPIYQTNNSSSRYLKLHYDEGSPTHPSTPAGHAVVAGAACTVLKAMFDCHYSDGVKRYWPSIAKHSINGTDLVDYLSTDAVEMTIVGEFNKLASNVSLGRDWSGVHYRMDGTLGMKLGEDYAITYLTDICLEIENAVHNFNGFILEKFNGDLVRITARGETNP